MGSEFKTARIFLGIPPFLGLVQTVTIAVHLKNMDIIDKPDDLLTSPQAPQQQQDVINRILAA